MTNALEDISIYVSVVCCLGGIAQMPVKIISFSRTMLQVFFHKSPKSNNHEALVAELINWIGFNGTFSTIRLYRAFRSYSLV